LSVIILFASIIIESFRVRVRPDRHSAQPDEGGCEMDEAVEMDGQPVIAGCEAAKVLEAVETSLDAVALLIAGFAAAACGAIFSSGRKASCSHSGDRVAYAIIWLALLRRWNCLSA
jgi:hypothetical protein